MCVLMSYKLGVSNREEKNFIDNSLYVFILLLTILKGKFFYISFFKNCNLLLFLENKMFLIYIIIHNFLGFNILSNNIFIIFFSYR